MKVQNKSINLEKGLYLAQGLIKQEYGGENPDQRFLKLKNAI